MCWSGARSGRSPRGARSANYVPADEITMAYRYAQKITRPAWRDDAGIAEVYRVAMNLVSQKTEPVVFGFAEYEADVYVMRDGNIRVVFTAETLRKIEEFKAMQPIPYDLVTGKIFGGGTAETGIYPLFSADQYKNLTGQDFPGTFDPTKVYILTIGPSEQGATHDGKTMNADIRFGTVNGQAKLVLDFNLETQPNAVVTADMVRFNRMTLVSVDRATLVPSGTVKLETKGDLGEHKVSIGFKPITISKPVRPIRPPARPVPVRPVAPVRPVYDLTVKSIAVTSGMGVPALSQRVTQAFVSYTKSIYKKLQKKLHRQSNFLLKIINLSENLIMKIL